MGSASGLLHIVQAADYGGPYAGSFVPMLTATAAEAARRGHTLEAVFSPVSRGRPWLAELESAGVPAHFADDDGARGLLRALRAALPAEGTAVVHTHFTGFDVPAIVAAATRRAPTGVIWHLHTGLQATPRARLANAVKFGLLGRRADRIVAVAPHLAAAARRRLAPAGRTIAMLNAIDTERFPRRDAQGIAEARAALGIDPAGPLVLHFGRDWRLKGGDLLLDAVRILADRGLEVTVLTVAGEDARRQADALGLSHRVRVIAPTLDVAALHTAADVFVSSSRREGMPYSLLEAAATGTGIVASEIPGQAELARAIPGARCAPLDAVPLADAIAALLARDPETAAAETAAARAWVREHADVQAAAARVIDLYEQVASGA